MPIKHPFESQIADGADSTLVQPSDWNANHAITTFGPFIMVAASNATAAEKEYAVASGGAVCDGTADQVEINAVLSGVGATVKLSGGTFTLSGSILFTNHGQQILASGWKTKLTTASAINIIAATDLGGGESIKGCYVGSLEIDGNNETALVGIYGRFLSRIVIDSPKIHDCKSWGIWLACQYAHTCTIINPYIHENGITGTGTYSGGVRIGSEWGEIVASNTLPYHNVKIIGGELQANKDGIVVMAGASNKFTCVVEGCTRHGIVIHPTGDTVSADLDTLHFESNVTSDVKVVMNEDISCTVNVRAVKVWSSGVTNTIICSGSYIATAKLYIDVVPAGTSLGSITQYVTSYGSGSAVTNNILVAASNATAAEKAYATASGGAICDGTADDVQIQAAINALTTGTVELSSGTFVLAASIVGKSYVTIFSKNGAILDARALAANDRVIEAIGSLATAVNLSSNAVMGDNHVHCTETTFAAGNLILVKSSAVWKSNTRSQHQGELQWVGSTASGVLNFPVLGGAGSGILADSYATADTAGVQKVTPIIDFVVDGIDFLGDDDITGVYIYFGVNCEVKNCKFTYVRAASVDFYSCYGGSIHDNYTLNEIGAGDRYGMVIEYASQGVVVHNNVARQCRHSVTVGGGSGTGINRNIMIHHNVSFDSQEAAFDSHPAAENVDFHYNVVQGGYMGITNYAPSGSIVGNEINHVVQSGINTVNSLITYQRIAYNSINGTGTYGILSDSPHVEIIGNYVVNTYNIGIVTSTNALKNRILYNRVDSASSDCIQIAGDNNVVMGNKFGGTVTPNDEVSISAGADGTIVMLNVFTSAAYYYNAGTNTLTKDNIGYVLNNMTSPIRVAATASSNADKNGALIICDGTNDEADWSTAQTAAGTGGLVLLCKGTYGIGANFTATATFRGVGRSTIVNLGASYTLTAGKDGDFEHMVVNQLTGHAGVGVRYAGEANFIDLSKGRGLWVQHANLGSPPSGSIGIQLRAYTTDSTAAYIDTCHFWFDGARGQEIPLSLLADGNASYTAYVNQNHIYGEWRQGKVACVKLDRVAAGNYEQCDYNIFHMSLEAYSSVTVNGIVLDCASYNEFNLGTSDWDGVATGSLIKLDNSSRWNAFRGTLNPAWAQLVTDNNSTKGMYTVLDTSLNREIVQSGLTSDGAWSGRAVAGVAGATLAFGDLVYFQTSDSRWELASCDNAAAGHNLDWGMCVLAAASDGAVTRILKWGYIRADAAFPTFTVGAPVYGSTTAGDVQIAAPSGTTDIVRKAGFGFTADTLFFNPSIDFLEIT